ncbi:response regulator transcription factor [Clostridium akagii]|uniref:response regulator transcription factor n=1 Tax=Clostridium akagii TaxID=91623 RepID=UPI00047A1ECB|nr:response regulator transcription factor [Clostridium akagii]
MLDNIKILIVEDDENINRLLGDMLHKNKYITKAAYSGTEALIYLENNEWDMVILDLMLPGIKGEDLLVKIRKHKQMPVIIISAKEGKDVRINTLKMGADDFISKPFDVDEVCARIDSSIRRYKEFSSASIFNGIFKYKEISLNKDNREVFVNEVKAPLTSIEFEILSLLITYPRKVFSKANVFESVWKSEYLCDDNTINVHISNLRSKLNKAGATNDYIQTVWGIGYKI